MSFDSPAIQIRGVSKRYQTYNNPRDRLKQFIVPRLLKLFGADTKPYYSEFWALQAATLDVAKGETVGIIGSNGSGKSTLLQIVCGTLQPTSGSVEIDGRVAALLELGAGFNPEYTGRENVFLNASVLGMSTEETLARFDDIAEFAGIGDHIDQPVKTYSSGMFVRLAFSVAVHVNPDVLVVDEALSVGDIAFQNRCMQRIQLLKRGGTSILFVSHDLSTVQIICDRVIWVKQGQIHQQGSASEVCQNYYAESMGAQTQTQPSAQIQIPQQSTGMAAFSRLRLMDGAGRETTSCTVGESLCIHFELAALVDLSETIFSISIYRADGDWSVGQTSAEKKVFWPAAKAGELLCGKLYLEPMSLTPAEYKICLSAFARDLQTCYAMTDVHLGFSVRSPYQTWGNFIHPCEWQRLENPTHANE